MTCPHCHCVFCVDGDFLPNQRLPSYCSATCQTKARRKRNGIKPRNKGINTGRQRVRNIRRKLWEKQDGICALCGEPMTAEDATVDHIVPQAHGGPSAISNLRLAHSGCNTERADECPGCPMCAPSAGLTAAPLTAS